MKRIITVVLITLLLFSFAAYGQESKTELNAEKKPATQITEDKNAEVYQLLDFDDKQEGEFANQGFMTAPESLVIKNEEDVVVWSQDVYDFVRDGNEAPAEANPTTGHTGVRMLPVSI